MAVAGGLLVVAILGWAAIARATAPTSNTDVTRFDAIIVLGSPADSDGNPTPEELARVTEGVREYERDVAPRMIFTGGATRKNYVEAQVMARAAEAQGIPASSILLEPEARDTIQNTCYSTRIMQAHGWQSAEVISSGYHLPRAGLILSRLPLVWRTHAAPPLEPESGLDGAVNTALETLKTARYLVYARWAEACTP
jgi:uncharacterized SAM-binding protein YcdF (DUF218 family)